MSSRKRTKQSLAGREAHVWEPQKLILGTIFRSSLSSLPPFFSFVRTTNELTPSFNPRFNLPADPSSAYPPQQIHIAFPRSSSELSDTSTRRHACFRLASLNALEELQKRIWGHYCARTGGRIGVEGSEEKRRDSAPMEADEPGQQNSGG